MKKLYWILLLSLSLVACNEGPHYAPVTEINTIDTIPQGGFHSVRRGETLYEIAWRYGLDYRFLAKRNQIKYPYTIYFGQKIYLHDPIVTERIAASPSLADEIKETEPESNLATHWLRPAKGRIINSFSLQNKGLNFSGSLGDPVYATASGKVVYCGNGLRGYGNLIILKHNSLYLSAYAHNQTLLVKEGQKVNQGQKIAEMGRTGSDKVMLHFEIRYAGKPIDPSPLLNS